MRFVKRLDVLRLAAVAVLATAGAVHAQQVSPPVTLQWFESSWQNIERRTADFHAAGYGAVWTPPPGRAVYIPQGGGIGYDPYDRFDLGRPRDPTLYGTEGSYKSFVKSVQKSGGNVYVDYVHHHVGSLDLNLNGYQYPQSLLSQGVPYLQDRSDYPGFELSDPNNSVSSPFHRDTYADLYGGNAGQRPFGDVFEYWFRLGENLVTIDLTSNRTAVRSPVPGNGQNVRQSPANWSVPTTTILSNGIVGVDNKLRQANVPTEDNRRLYPDLNGPSRTVVDRGVSYTVYDFNTANPSAGDPVAETTLGYMQRYAQWMTQVVGVDGLRIDAARHVPLGVFNSGYNPNSLNVPLEIDRATAFGTLNRKNLDGTTRNAFNFQEVFSYDSNLLKSFIRKSQQPGDTVNPNREVLDFSMWAAMGRNMTGNGLQNDWYQIRSAGINAAVYNTLNPNIANNGDNGIGFVYNHDEGVTPPGQGAGNTIALDNVAHAWILMRPGNAYVYYRSDEFNRSGNNNFFLKQGRGDALGGQYGSIITTLVDVRNSYGRGDFIERFIDNTANPSLKSAVYAFERQGSAVVGLNIGYNPGVATRTMQTSFAPGTRLEEVTGNWQDPSGLVDRVVAVNGSGQVTIDIPWNNLANGNKGYVVYGLPRPRGALAVTTTAGAAVGTFGAEALNPSNNGTALINAIDVITSDTFKVRLNTNAVTLADGFRDTFADGDRALIRLNEGLDVNGNGVLDNPSSAASNATTYGFESFLTTNTPGFGNGGAGTYEQVINAAGLSEGYHFVTVRAWRKQGASESEVFQDFRKTIYVDRLDPVSAVDSTAQFPYQTSTQSRDIRIKSTDGTADSVHVFLDLGAALSDAQILALVNNGNKTDRIDADLFGRRFDGVGSGNHVVTSVTFEPTGNFSVQRFVGQFIGTTRGLGLGDTNFDGGYAPGDVTTFENVLYTQDQQFNAAGDMNGDGRVNNVDLFALPGRYASVMASQAFTEALAAVRRRGDFTGNYVSPANAGDIDDLYANFGPYQWKYDLNSDGGPIDSSDLNVMLSVILGTRFGDANLDSTVNLDDFTALAANFGLPGGWAQGNFDGQGFVALDDFTLLAANFGLSGPSAPALRGAFVPEPASIGGVLMIGGLVLRRRRN
ncbi:MAG TPA: PEP-CTERM sorting domain-containing protein [Tepidisphaeraceae bacterium]|nr:PEP-CTERM sorting domain-containing protein [Tepidisphaeraceae bacterium]